MNKSEHLKQYLQELKSAAVAFSGGVDSVFLLKSAHDILGNNVIAVTASSCLFPKRELTEAAAFCEKENIKHIIFEFDELSVDGFCENPVNRCYICKTALFKKITEIAVQHGIRNIVEGSNVDDMSDYRPGLQAVAELGIKSPLRAAGLTKAEIRSLSKELGLSAWKKPSFACLASRFEYGDIITQEKLSMIDRAEQLLLDLGFVQARVRIKDKTARIEILPEEFEKLIQKETREKIVSEFNKIGFNYVSMDLKGYRTGSMNEGIEI